MIGTEVALIGVLGVVLGALLSQRGARRVAGEDRLWARRADTYLELLDWLHHDLAAHRHGRHDPIPRELDLRYRLDAFGTEGLDRALALYDRDRGRALAGDARSERALNVRAALVTFTIRVDLGELPSRRDRVLLGLLGSRAVLGPLSRLRARRAREEVAGLEEAS